MTRLILILVLAAAIVLSTNLAQAQFLNGPPGADMLTPENVITQARLSQQDVTTFIDLFTYLLASGSQVTDINTFSRTRGISMLRLNHITVKIAFKFLPQSTQKSIVNELGLAILLNDQEKKLIVSQEAQLAPIIEYYKGSY
ncbi:MAG: hypothetical protein LBT47_07745 [Deltaproteobacteria bacterium]|jgi:hypothetical protein|nr:hypothetical protein [Deltaproteobacteria bacterium]